MHHAIKSLAVGSTLTSAVLISGVAQAGASANIAVASQYIWRGVTQSDEQAAVQGGLDYATDNGLYVGTWLSNVDFGEGDTGIEIDLYGGFAGELDSFGYDFGVIYYAYPVQDDINFLEIFASGSYGPLSTGVYVTVEAEDGAEGGDDTPNFYVPVSLDFDLGIFNGIGLSVYGGYYEFDNDDLGEDYAHYGASFSKDVGDFGQFVLAIDKNNLDDDKADDPRVSVLWTKEFEL